MEKIFSENLRFLRYRKGVSVPVLARAIHVSEQAIRFWEEGKRLPGAKNLKALADYFGVPPETMMTDMMKITGVEGSIRGSGAAPQNNETLNELREIKALLSELVSITRGRN